MPYDGSTFETETKVELDEVGKVLLRAADNLRRFGWIQELWCNDNGMCARMAIRFGTNSPSVIEGAYKTLAKHLRLADPIDIIEWNDRDGRTAEEVISALQAAAYARGV